MTDLIKSIALGLIQATAGVFIEMYRAYKLEQAERRADNLERYIRAKESNDKEEEGYKALVKKHEDAAARVKTSKEKLDAIRTFNGKEPK